METKSKIIIGSFIGVFVLILIGIFASNLNLFVMASTNEITYTNDDLTVTIKDELGTTLGDLTLTSHISTDEIRIVPFGQEEVVMYYDFSNWDFLKDGLGKVYFKDMKTGEIVQKDYYFVELTLKTIEVDDYGPILGQTLNGSDMYDWGIVGNHKEDVWIETKLDTNDIPDRDIRIGLKTYVEQGDHFDAVWTIAGKTIDKHAEWGAGESHTRTTTLTMQYPLPSSPVTWRGGIKITVGYEHVFLTKVTTMPNTLATWAYIIAPSDGEFLANSTMTNDNATFDYMLEGNESYYIMVGNPDATWLSSRRDSLSFPIDMTEVSFVAGAQGTKHPYTEDAARAWDIASLDLAEAIFLGPGFVLNITGNFNFSNGTDVNNADVVAFWVENNTVAKNTTSDASGNWQLVSMPNGTYIIVGYDPNNESINGDVQAFVTVGT